MQIDQTNCSIFFYGLEEHSALSRRNEKCFKIITVFSMIQSKRKEVSDKEIYRTVLEEVDDFFKASEVSERLEGV